MPFTKGNWDFYMTYSDDDGVTWKEPYQLHGLKKFGETWVGFGPPSGIQTTSGRLLLPAYASSVPIYDNGIFTYSFVVYSDDNGLTWHRGARVPSGGWLLDFFTGNFGNEAEIVEVRVSDERVAHDVDRRSPKLLDSLIGRAVRNLEEAAHQFPCGVGEQDPVDLL